MQSGSFQTKRDVTRSKKISKMHNQTSSINLDVYVINMSKTGIKLKGWRQGAVNFASTSFIAPEMNLIHWGEST